MLQMREPAGRTAPVQTWAVAAVRGRLAAQAASLLQAMIDAEASARCQAAPYQRTRTRVAVRQGSYRRVLRTDFGDVAVRMPRLGQTLGSGLPAPGVVERSVLQLAAGISTWSAVQSLIAPMRAHHGDAGWIAALARDLLAMSDAARLEPMPVVAERLAAVRICSDDPSIGRLAVAAAVAACGERRHAWFARVDGAGQWRQMMEAARGRGLLGVEAISPPEDPDLIAAIAGTWPQAQATSALG